jgi:hypothetical protein
MAGYVLHPLLRFKEKIDKRFANKDKEKLYEVFGGGKRLTAFQDLLRLVYYDYGDRLMANIDWSDDELSKLKKIKKSRQLTVDSGEKK